MDLIYADENRKDIGVLNAYDFDMAFGSDENDFECRIDRSAHCMTEGYFLYVEGEEYGGIVDSVSVNTSSDEVTYSGRTWHGILESKVIYPESGQDYLVLDGEANEVLSQLISSMGLSELFRASDDVSDIQIQSYQMARYAYGYTGIKAMLKDADAKLKIKWSDGMVELSAEPVDDYSQDEEFDTSQVDFNISRSYNTVNHIICLGQGNLRDRAVIHIFADKNGGIQPYAKIDIPLQDSDYILDESKKAVTGNEEIVEVYDYPNAEITENYIALTSKPKDWEAKCESYYEHDGDSYKEVEKETTETYTALSSKPSDWDKKYTKYYIKSGNSYKAAEGTTTTAYKLLAKKPTDWSRKWSSYYYYYSDGISSEYKTVDGVTKYKYTKQTQKPTDWDDKFTSYYRHATASELKKDKKTKYYSVKGTTKKVNGKNVTVAPKWSQRSFYTQTSYSVAPAYKGKYYIKKDTTTAPTWSSGTYYQLATTTAAPNFVKGNYYKMVKDRYAVMVAEAIEKIEEYYQNDELTIDLEETEQTYDVGDIVGAIEETTGIKSVQEVTKKIIKINNDDISITYEVN